MNDTAKIQHIRQISCKISDFVAGFLFWGTEAGVEAAEPLLTENRQMRGVAWREGAVGRCNTATYGTWGEGIMAGGVSKWGVSRYNIGKTPLRFR